jgi:hypothetical protein
MSFGTLAVMNFSGLSVPFMGTRYTQSNAVSSTF